MLTCGKTMVRMMVSLRLPFVLYRLRTLFASILFPIEPAIVLLALDDLDGVSSRATTDAGPYDHKERREKEDPQHESTNFWTVVVLHE